MDSLVLHRFRGAIAGAVLGELLGWESIQPSDAPHSSLFCRAHDRFNRPVRAVAGNEPFGLTMRSTLERLIVAAYPPTNLEAIARLSFASDWHIFAAALPLALYYHDDRASLQSALTAKSVTPEMNQAVQIFTQAIALGWETSLSIEDLILRLVDTIDVSGESSLAIALQELQSSLEMGQGIQGLEQWIKAQGGRTGAAATVPAHIPVAIALYLASATPQGGALPLWRSQYLGILPPLTGLLTGALVGLYGGVSALPLDWRVRLAQSHQEQHALQSTWGVPCWSEVLGLGDRLFSTWSGVY